MPVTLSQATAVKKEQRPSITLRAADVRRESWSKSILWWMRVLPLSMRRASSGLFGIDPLVVRCSGKFVLWNRPPAGWNWKREPNRFDIGAGRCHRVGRTCRPDPKTRTGI